MSSRVAAGPEAVIAAAGHELLVALAQLLERHPDLHTEPAAVPELLDELTALLRRSRGRVARARTTPPPARPTPATPAAPAGHPTPAAPTAPVAGGQPPAEVTRLVAAVRRADLDRWAVLRFYAGGGPAGRRGHPRPPRRAAGPVRRPGPAPAAVPVQPRWGRSWPHLLGGAVVLAAAVLVLLLVLVGCRGAGGCPPADVASCTAGARAATVAAAGAAAELAPGERARHPNLNNDPRPAGQHRPRGPDPPDL